MVESVSTQNNAGARAPGRSAMVARYDRAMQSSRVLAPEDLDRPIRSALPNLARGAAALGKLGIGTPREALWHLPFRYDDFSELRPLRRARPRREAIGPRACRGRPGRARVRQASAAGDRPAERPVRHGRGHLVRSAVRRAAAFTGRRAHRIGQGGGEGLATAVHVSGVQPDRSRLGPHGARRARLPPRCGRDPETAARAPRPHPRRLAGGARRSPD